MSFLGLTLASTVKELQQLNQSQELSIKSLRATNAERQRNVEDMGTLVRKQEGDLKVVNEQLTNSTSTIESLSKDVESHLRTINTQSACRGNTNDKLRVHGQALASLNKHIGNKPEGKVSPKVRTEWNDKFFELANAVFDTEVKQVTIPAQLPSAGEVATGDKK